MSSKGAATGFKQPTHDEGVKLDGVQIIESIGTELPESTALSDKSIEPVPWIVPPNQVKWPWIEDATFKRWVNFAKLCFVVILFFTNSS